MAGNAEKLSSTVVRAAEPGEPRGAASEYSRGYSDGLDVGDSGGAPENTDVSGEWGLKAGLALATLEGLDQSSLLATDVCLYRHTDRHRHRYTGMDRDRHRES